MTSIGTIPERVARGAAWLDQERPGWRDEITPTDLEMAECCKCILGQVFAAEAATCPADHFWTGYDVGLELSSDDYQGDWSEAHGFTCYDHKWRELEEAWLSVIHSGRVTADAPREPARA